MVTEPGPNDLSCKTHIYHSPICGGGGGCGPTPLREAPVLTVACVCVSVSRRVCVSVCCVSVNPCVRVAGFDVGGTDSELICSGICPEPSFVGRADTSRGAQNGGWGWGAGAYRPVQPAQAVFYSTLRLRPAAPRAVGPQPIKKAVAYAAHH